MVKIVSTFVVAALTVIASDAQHQTNDVLLTMPVTIDGSLRNLQLLKGESFEDAAMSFARSNGLMATTNDVEVRSVINQLTGMLEGKMREVEAAQQPHDQPLPTVQLSIPLTIDGYSGDLKKYESETSEAAVERFLGASGFSTDVIKEVYPQLVSLINKKLEELQPPKKELFSFVLSLDGREITVRHFEEGNPMEEAVETLRGIGVNDGEFLDRVAPQIANQIVSEINKRLEATTAPSINQEQQIDKSLMQQQQSQRREIFSETLTINNQRAVMVHFEGSTARETAIGFLNENGITDDATIESLLPQLIDIVDTRMAALLAQADAAAEAQLQTQSQSQEESNPKPQRQPLVTVPIQLDGQNQANLEYFEGDDVEATVQRFLQAVGLDHMSPNFNDNVIQLSELVREQIAAVPLQQQHETSSHSKHPEPLFSFPVTLSGKVFNLEYFEGQEPYYVANSFCVEKYEIIREELGVNFDDEQLLECQNVLVQSISNLLEKEQQTPTKDQQPTAEIPADSETSESVEHPTPTKTEPQLDPRGLLLFTLDIDMGDGTAIQLPVHRNDNPRELASSFCTQHQLDQENVPALVDAMEAQLKDL